jgi:hypothetical protein
MPRLPDGRLAASPASPLTMAVQPIRGRGPPGDAGQDAGEGRPEEARDMDEVEELCDRVAILERGRIAALDTPAGLVDSAGGEYRVRFRPMAPLDEQSLALVPGVTSVTRRGAQADVTGTGDFASAVTAELTRRQVIVADLLFFPNMFLAGVYFPTEEMSSVMRQVGNFTPLGSALHAVRDSWMGIDPRPEYLGIMAAWALVGGALAARFFRWDQA